MIYGIFGNALAQKFYVEYQEEGFYKIIAMHTGKCLSVKDNSIKENMSIVQYEYQSLDSQKWIFVDTKINGWLISPLSNPNLCISINGSIGNGSNLVLSEVKNNNNQMFYLINISKDEKVKANGIYKIAVGANSFKTIEVKGSNKSNNALTGIWNYRKCISSKVLF